MLFELCAQLYFAPVQEKQAGTLIFAKELPGSLVLVRLRNTFPYGNSLPWHCIPPCALWDWWCSSVLVSNSQIPSKLALHRFGDLLTAVSISNKASGFINYSKLFHGSALGR